MVKSKIVEAHGVATMGGNPATSKKIQDAMNAAILECAEKGITDPAKVKEAMMTAREKAKSDIAKAPA